MRIIFLCLLLFLSNISFAQKEDKSKIQKMNKSELRLEIKKREKSLEDYKEMYERKKESLKDANEEIRELKSLIDKYQGKELTRIDKPDSTQLAAYERLKDTNSKNENELEDSKTRERRLRTDNENLKILNKKYKGRLDSVLQEQKQVYQSFKELAQRDTSTINQSNVFPSDTPKRDSVLVVSHYKIYYDSLLVTIFKINNKYTEKPKKKPKVEVKKERVVVTISPKAKKLRTEISEYEGILKKLKEEYEYKNVFVQNFFTGETILPKSKYKNTPALEENDYSVYTTRIGNNEQGLLYEISSTAGSNSANVANIAKCFLKGLERFSGVTDTPLQKREGTRIEVILNGSNKLVNQVKYEFKSIEDGVDYVIKPKLTKGRPSIVIKLTSETFFTKEYRIYQKDKSRYDKEIKKRENKLKNMNN